LEFLGNSKIHSPVHMSSPLFPILSQIIHINPHHPTLLL